MQRELGMMRYSIHPTLKEQVLQSSGKVGQPQRCFNEKARVDAGFSRCDLRLR